MDVISVISDKYYDEFTNALDEYIFMAMTEDCHPMIEDLERIHCIAEGMDWEDYIDGRNDWDEILQKAQDSAHRVVESMFRKYYEMNYG